MLVVPAEMPSAWRVYEILGFNCVLDILGEGEESTEGINGLDPRWSCAKCNLCSPGQRGRMFNWAFGRARPNANVSHNPACQLTLLETSSSARYTDGRSWYTRDKSDNWFWIDARATARITTRAPRKTNPDNDYWGTYRGCKSLFALAGIILPTRFLAGLYRKWKRIYDFCTRWNARIIAI